MDLSQAGAAGVTCDVTDDDPVETAALIAAPSLAGAGACAVVTQNVFRSMSNQIQPIQLHL